LPESLAPCIIKVNGIVLKSQWLLSNGTALRFAEQPPSGKDRMPKQTSYTQQDPGTPAGRIALLLRVVWAGHQRRMAEDLSVSQATISKIVRGERAPGSKLLDAVARDPRVNRMWLLEGVGEPLRAEHREAPVDECLVPVARIILPGPPREHAGLLAGPRIPVAAFFFRPSRYLLEIGADAAVVPISELKIAPGDMLLLETDSATWQGDVRILKDRLCAVRGEAGDRRQHLLAKARVDTREGTLSFDVYGHDGGTETIIRRSNKRVRPVDTGERDTRRSQTADDLPETPAFDSARPDDPIGAALVEERPPTAQGQGPKPSGETIESCRPGAANEERVVAFCVLLIRL
jgi:transcriptional regulator with XRE-family HTH domain